MYFIVIYKDETVRCSIYLEKYKCHVGQKYPLMMFLLSFFM